MPYLICFFLGMLVGSLVVWYAFFRRLSPVLNSRLNFVGGGFLRTYAQDRPTDVVGFSKPTVVDSEGGAVDPQPDLSYLFSSSDESIASVTDNGDGTLNVSYGTARKQEDGSYAMAEIKAESNEITLPSGEVIKDVKTEQIQLVPGAAAGFSGGGFNFPEV